MERESGRLGVVSLASYSPAPDPPPSFSRRRFSFSIEFYQSLARSHARLLWVFTVAFPNPLKVHSRALRREGAVDGLARGDLVIRDGVEGRMVGRHPVSGTPVVAWNPENYHPMCEAFDTENAALLVSWRENIERLTYTTADCTRHALRIDRGLRWMLVIITALFMVTTAVFGLLGGGLTGGLLGLLSGIMGGALFSLPMLLIVAVGGLIGVRWLAMCAGLWIGLWARRKREQATITDEAGRISAEAIVAAMQGNSVEDDEAVQQTAQARQVLQDQQR